jgi:hypothetical protein
MIVRIRFGHGPTVQQRQRKNKHVALALASLLTPAVVMTCVLAFWRLTADFKATGQFPITRGLFSHWQVWLGSAALLQLFAIALNRYGNSQPVIRKAVEEPQQKLVGEQPVATRHTL